MCIGIVLCFAAGFVSCWEKMEEPAVILEFAVEGIAVSVAGTSDTTIAGGIQVRSNTRWIIDTAAIDTTAITMCRVGDSDTIIGHQNGVLNLTIAENNDKDAAGNFIPRSLAVTLYVGDTFVEPQSITLGIEQGAGAYRIRLDQDSVSVGRAAGEVTVGYDINSAWGTWNIITPSEVTVEATDNENEVLFSYPANTSGVEREFVVTFRINLAPYPETLFRIVQSE